MSFFHYEALDAQGVAVKGVIDAESLQEAKQKLLEQEIFVTEVTPSSRKSQGLSQKDLLALTKELARLLRAGLPLYESLRALQEKYRDHGLQSLLLDLSEKIRAGIAYSKALAAYPTSFDLVYCAIVENAERSGQLTTALEELARVIQQRLSLRKQLAAVLLYPSILTGFCLIVLGILLFFAVPSLFELFEGRSLHPFTRFVFQCSQLALRGKWVLVFFSLSMVAGGVWTFTSFKGRAMVRSVFLRVPGLKVILEKLALARFFCAAAVLLKGGLPALVAFRQATTVLQHPELENIIFNVADQLERGSSLEQAFITLNSPLIPSMIPRMLGIAQQGGNLAAMCEQIAAIAEEELEKTFAKITALAQPILLLVLGAMIGFVLLSVLLPLTDVNSLAM